MTSRFTIMLMLSVVSAVVFTGCVASTPTGGSVYTRLQSEDPSVRIQAAVEAGKDRDRKAIPLLVDCLDDTESDVRMFAGMSLKRIVGEQTYNGIGWKFYLTRAERREAVQRWRAWVANNCGNGGMTDWEKLDARFKDEKGQAAAGGQTMK